MKRIHTITLVLFLLLGQWGTVDHVYHEHSSGEVCDYCLSAQPLDHGLIAAFSFSTIRTSFPNPVDTRLNLVSTGFINYYSVRAPPLFI